CSARAAEDPERPATTPTILRTAIAAQAECVSESTIIGKGASCLTTTATDVTPYASPRRQQSCWLSCSHASAWPPAAAPRAISPRTRTLPPLAPEVSRRRAPPDREPLEREPQGLPPPDLAAPGRARPDRAEHASKRCANACRRTGSLCPIALRAVPAGRAVLAGFSVEPAVPSYRAG